MGKKKIAVATPTRDGLVEINYTATMFHLQKQLGDEYDFELTMASGVSDISAGRNKIFNKWYFDTDVEYLLWVDSDISFAPLDLKKLMEYDVDVIGGNYPKKKIDVKNLLETAALMQRMNGEVHAEECLHASMDYVVGGRTNILQGGKHDGLGTCEMLGMGLMLLSRKGADKIVEWCDKNMEKKFWAWGDTQIEGYGVFDPLTTDDRKNLAEDFAFCQRMKESGLTLYFHPAMLIRHSGYMSFDGNFEEVVKLAKKAFDAGENMPGTLYEKPNPEESNHVSEFED